MKKIFFVVFLLLFSQVVLADDMEARVSKIEATWVDTSVDKSQPQRENIFLKLTKDISRVVMSFPNQAKPLILKSAILLTMAEDASSFVALGLVKQAKALLDKAIDLDPSADEGSALVTMGVLYYKVPGWPVAFGDNEAAESYLLKALEVDPDGVASNYYYADFLLEQGKKEQAVSYLHKAATAPIDSNTTSFKIKLEQKYKAKAALAAL